MVGEEVLEEWDADFLDQVMQVEELALSANPAITTSTSAVTSLSRRLPPLPQQHQQFYNNDFVSYSPPRELSQRPPNDSSYFDRSINGITKLQAAPSTSSVTSVPRADTAKDLEIQRLKGELGRVSKQLTKLEYECSELQKERKKEEQLISVVSHYEEKGSDFHSVKYTDFGRGHGVVTEGPHKVSQQFKQAKSINEIVGSRNNDRRTISTCRAIGVQTEEAIDVIIPVTSHDDHPTCPDLSEKLLGIWQSTSDQDLGKKLVSALFRTCPTDFHVLFGCMGMNASSKMRVESPADESTSVVALDYRLHSTSTSDTEKVSDLYSVLTKISTGMLKLDALFKLLVDLCSLENVVIIHRSLRILRVFLKQLFCLGRKAELRDNVKFEGLCSSNKVEDFSGSGYMKNRTCFVDRAGTFYAGNMPFGIQSSNAEILYEKEQRNHGTLVLLSCINWGSLFEHMHQIAMRNTEERVRLEAVSIMNEIVMSNSIYVEGEKFGTTLLFESISQLLRKESGLLMQKEALHLLHLLLNCPKLLAMFCSGCIEGESMGAADDDVLSSLTCKGFHRILESLANCVACTGNSVQVLELRRNSIILLSFLASTGRSGVEILINYKLSREANFLMFILQVLVSEMDTEAAVFAEPRICSEPADICKARNLLIREALILLNRLVSNAAYSAPVLRVLTNSRDMASLTIDIVNRLSRQNQKLCQFDSKARQMRKSEIIDLAQVFKRRVFAYLGENVS